MRNYQQKDLASGTNVGVAAPLLSCLEGLPDYVLENPGAFLDPDAVEAMGYTGRGFFYVEPVVVPVPVTTIKRWFGKAALLNAGKLEAADDLVAGSDDRMLKLMYNEWENWARTNVYIENMGAALGLNPAAIDALFEDAGSMA